MVTTEDGFLGAMSLSELRLLGCLQPQGHWCLMHRKGSGFLTLSLYSVAIYFSAFCWILIQSFFYLCLVDT